MKGRAVTLAIITTALLMTVIVIIAIVVYYNPNPGSSSPKRRQERKYKSVSAAETGPLPISAGVLTYFAPKTLAYTLSTYRDSGFLRHVDDFFVVIQKSDRQEQERQVCETFKVRHILLPDNGHMASGFKAIYAAARNDVVLFLENDFIIREGSRSKEAGAETEPRHFLQNALHFLQSGYDYVKARSRFHAGEPNYALNFHKAGNSIVENTHLSESMYWDDHPEQTHPSKISALPAPYGNDTWYSASSKYCNYSNNPFFCTRSFFESEILPHLFYGENIEDRLTPIWALRNYKCVFGSGLFTHNRSYDGHT